MIQDYGFRLYNPAIGKFLSVDPLTKEYPWFTPYQFAGNMPINSIDLDGLENMTAITPMNDGNGPGAVELNTNSRGSLVPPAPTLDPNIIKAAGYDASKYSFTYVESEEYTEIAAGANGFRYDVTYDGRNIGSVYVNACQFTGKPIALSYYLQGTLEISDASISVHAEHPGVVEPALDAVVAASNYGRGINNEELAAIGTLEFIGNASSSVGVIKQNIKDITQTAHTPVDYTGIDPKKGPKAGANFTAAQKKAILEKNKAANGGVIKSDLSGKVLNQPKKDVKGVKTDMNSAQVDHWDSKKNGGTNAGANAKVLSKYENTKFGSKKK